MFFQVVVMVMYAPGRGYYNLKYRGNRGHKMEQALTLANIHSIGFTYHDLHIY